MCLYLKLAANQAFPPFACRFSFDAFESHVFISHGQPPEERIYFKYSSIIGAQCSQHLQMNLRCLKTRFRTRRYHFLLTFPRVINKILRFLKQCKPPSRNPMNALKLLEKQSLPLLRCAFSYLKIVYKELSQHCL